MTWNDEAEENPKSSYDSNESKLKEILDRKKQTR